MMRDWPASGRMNVSATNVIVGTGSYLPEQVVTNHDIESAVTDYDPLATAVSLDDWVRRTHGAVSRRKLRPEEATSDMATRAARNALEDAGLGANDIDLLVLATCTGDYPQPPSAALVQAKLATRAKFLQIEAACSGFVDALLVAHGLLGAGRFQTALVIGADTFSRISDPQSFLPLTVFGDGAGAVVVARRDDLDGYGIRAFCTGADGQLGAYATVEAGGSRLPGSPATLDRGEHYLRYDFSGMQSWEAERMAYCAREATQRAGIGLSDLAWVVPQQASSPVVRELAQQLAVPLSKFVETYPYTGNTSAASIPIAVDEANRRRSFADGDWLVMPAAGAGMAWGAVAYRWHDYSGAPAARTRTG
jgi:3-oxoacyl-[acyl-carrier-protein] synthase III